MLQRHVVGILAAATLGCFVATPALAYQREIQSAADALAEKLAASGKRSIAVVDFTDLQGNVTELGRFLAEELSVALASGSRPIEMVDRTHLKVLLQEHKLSSTGLIDPATAKKLGQIAGVDALVTGTLTAFGDTVRMAIKVLDTSTARIVAATTAEIAKTKRIEELDKQGVGSAASASRSTSRDAAPAPSPMPEPVETEGLRFTLKRCARAGGGLRCELLIENLTESATNLYFYASAESVLYDSSGNQYVDAAVSLGTSASSGRHASQELLPGIPLAAKITFSGVPSGITEGSLSLSFKQPGTATVGGFYGHTARSDSVKVVFRHVPLS